MTDKELKKLRRDDLLQILINQQRQIDELTAAVEKANAALENRRIIVSKSGSVAEAALALNGVFEAAQAAADQYQAQMRIDTDALRAQGEEAAEKSKRVADDLLATARGDAERILNEARREAEQTRAEAQALLDEYRKRTGTEPPPLETAPQEEEPRQRRGLFGRNRKS